MIIGFPTNRFPPPENDRIIGIFARD